MHPLRLCVQRPCRMYKGQKRIYHTSIRKFGSHAPGATKNVGGQPKILMQLVVRWTTINFDAPAVKLNHSNYLVPCMDNQQVGRTIIHRNLVVRGTTIYFSLILAVSHPAYDLKFNVRCCLSYVFLHGSVVWSFDQPFRELYEKRYTNTPHLLQVELQNILLELLRFVL